MLKYVFGIVALIVLIASGFYFFKMMSEIQDIPSNTEPPAQLPTGTSTYATSSFSVVYPNSFTMDEAYQYTGFAGKPISGVKFFVPTTMATGTNLSADSGVSIEWLPRANTCSADIYMLQNVRATTVVDGGVTYSLATSTEAAAGNLYEEYVYAFPGSSPCTAVRYFIHSTQIANYPEGTVREFNRSLLIGEFDAIRRAIQFKTGSPTFTP